MLVGDDDQAAVVTAILAAALLQNARATDASQAAACFQQVASALHAKGAICAAVANRQVMGSRVSETREGASGKED